MNMTCPACGCECERDEVDNGVGMEACGPWGCPECHWIEERLAVDDDPRTVDEVIGAELPHERVRRG